MESEEDEEGDNPYSSYQQFHRDLSTHDDPKSELLEFEFLEQGEFKWTSHSVWATDLS